MPFTTSTKRLFHASIVLRLWPKYIHYALHISDKKGRSVLQSFQLDIINIVQNFSSPLLDTFFSAVSEFGVTGFVMLLCFLCYFCFDKELGRRLGFTVLLGLSLGCALKDALRVHRPIGIGGIRTLNADNLRVSYSPDGYEYSYSLPSNHSLASAAAWSTLGFYYKRPVVWACGCVLTLLAGLSRIYLGVHYPLDVLTGIAIGFLVSVAALIATHYLWDVKVFYAAVALLLLAYMRFSPPSSDTVRSIASLLGLIAGCWLDDTFVNYQISKSNAGNLIALAGAVSVLAAAYLALGRVLPGGPVSDFAKYFALCFLGSGIYPAIVAFIRRFDWQKPASTHGQRN